MKVPPKEIFGEKIKLRPVRPEDEQMVHEYASDPEVVRYMSWGPNSIEQTRSHLKGIFDQYSKGDAEDVEWTIEVINNRAIGKCTLYTSNGIIHLGYVINRNYWGKGYTTEAAKLLIKAAFEDYGVDVVRATCDVNNIASAKVMEKAGMKYLQTEEVELEKGKKRLSKIYEIKKGDWKKH